jgi:hypothetical protein
MLDKAFRGLMLFPNLRTSIPLPNGQNTALVTLGTWIEALRLWYTCMRLT